MMAKIVLGALVLTADVETAIRFSLRTNADCGTSGQSHVLGGFAVSPLAHITEAMVADEERQISDGLPGLRLATGDEEQEPETVRVPRADDQDEPRTLRRAS